MLDSLVALSDKVLARKGPEARDPMQGKAGALLLLAERTARTDAERDSLTARGDATFDTFMALAPARSPEQDAADKHLAVQEAREAAMTKVTGNKRIWSRTRRARSRCSTPPRASQAKGKAMMDARQKGGA